MKFFIAICLLVAVSTLEAKPWRGMMDESQQADFENYMQMYNEWMNQMQQHMSDHWGMAGQRPTRQMSEMPRPTMPNMPNMPMPNFGQMMQQWQQMMQSMQGMPFPFNPFMPVPTMAG